MKENNNINEQIIKEAIKEIVQGTEADEKHVENIQEIFELNPWLLEKLTDEQLKIEYIKLLYSREHLTNTLLAESREKHLLSEENKTLGKTVLEIILRYSEKNHPSEYKTDLEIFSLLCGADWKERTGFSVDEKGVVSWKEVDFYQEKPQEIIENYYFEQSDQIINIIINELKLGLNKDKFKTELDLINKDKTDKEKIGILRLVLNKEKEIKEKLEDKVEKLQKELEEKKLLITNLENENKRLKEQNNQKAQIEQINK